ncbi:hypothetical protein HMPREF9318_02029 [Streptococcus urinalis FB127-CNA-2]|uniref:Uncharacterized protein n=1 Tax=Streptococcus urinalis 2285-97 TaxID=764291 RepID=G5KCK8_9STRE|nr:hypothetical protein [Streptococcus urinalis]EHJ57378.1 hypothetical protein STRUR_1747 [Streptococcus urinalis 2285-97]EKS17152.1 hypothetical protein HMPREF9318_02029 [Streptococcus urinalis FB127-CNA-2]VEF32598.1 Uncharacterised protein [Streptococcus urinalis]
MTNTTVTDRIEQLRQRYLYNPCESQDLTFQSNGNQKQIAKLKKKLMMLEKERCQKRFEKKDIQAIYQKIKETKDQFKQLIANKKEG